MTALFQTFLMTLLAAPQSAAPLALQPITAAPCVRFAFAIEEHLRGLVDRGDRAFFSPRHFSAQLTSRLTDPRLAAIDRAAGIAIAHSILDPQARELTIRFLDVVVRRENEYLGREAAASLRQLESLIGAAAPGERLAMTKTMAELGLKIEPLLAQHDFQAASMETLGAWLNRVFDGQRRQEAFAARLSGDVVSAYYGISESLGESARLKGAKAVALASLRAYAHRTREPLTPAVETLRRSLFQKDPDLATALFAQGPLTP